jgi:hypothetical protein
MAVAAAEAPWGRSLMYTILREERYHDRQIRTCCVS